MTHNWQRVRRKATELLPGVFLLLSLLLFSYSLSSAKPSTVSSQTVYDNQPKTTEKELLSFLTVLPEFRVWAQSHQEEAHPGLTNGRPDFFYSQNAEKWITSKGWDARRFFCVMGRMAAALVVATEGNDLRGTRPADMPDVSDFETELAHKHLGRMLEAGGAVAPKVNTSPPLLPIRDKR
ncbi:MAG: serine/threonine protein phosphatase [Desulfovibrio sp.]|nr:serine/threonine protein phosphatase [Desulfovibrio sp.]